VRASDGETLKQIEAAAIAADVMNSRVNLCTKRILSREDQWAKLNELRDIALRHDHPTFPPHASLSCGDNCRRNQNLPRFRDMNKRKYARRGRSTAPLPGDSRN